MINNTVKSLATSDTGFILLLIATIGDLVIPYLVAPFCKKYSHVKMVMSLLGRHNTPVHTIYNLWLIAAGIMLILGSLRLYPLFSPISAILTKILLLCILLYAAGACILSGIFPVGETKTLTTVPEKIHGYGSASGFLVLLLVPLIIGILSLHSNKPAYATTSLLSFALAILFFTLFVMADKERFSDTIISNEGLWQKLSLLFMYTPLITVSLKNLL